MTKSGKPHYSPQPLDYLLLELMPDQGTIGGVHWKGRRARDLRQMLLDNANGELTAEMLPMSGVQARLRSMAVVGYVKNYGAMGASGTKIWARTPQGVAFLNAREG